MRDLSQIDYDNTEKIHAIETACFEKPWGKTVILMSLTNDFAIYFIEDYGYIIGTSLSGEYELLRVAVLPEFRRKGCATDLVGRFLEKCRGDVFLEADENNYGAIMLYKKFGFEVIAHRKDYYGAGKNAVSMKREYTNEHN